MQTLLNSKIQYLLAQEQKNKLKNNMSDHDYWGKSKLKTACLCSQLDLSRIPRYSKLQYSKFSQSIKIPREIHCDKGCSVGEISAADVQAPEHEDIVTSKVLVNNIMEQYSNQNLSLAAHEKISFLSL